MKPFIFAFTLLVLAALGPSATAASSAPGWCFTGPPDAMSPYASHSLTAGARSGPGGVVTIDAVNGIAVHGPVTASASQPLLVRGWAVDSDARSAAQLLVSVDGGPARRADSCIPRPDVALAWHIDDYTASGFTVRLPPLHSGRHRLAFSTYAADQRILSAVTELIVIAHGPDAAEHITGAIDRFDGVAGPPGTVVQRHDSDVRIDGWLAEWTPVGLRPLRALDVIVDGHVVDRATYGRRPGSTAQHVGYSSRFAADILMLGRHELKLRATLASGKRVFAETVVQLDVVAPPPFPLKALPRTH